MEAAYASVVKAADAPVIEAADIPLVKAGCSHPFPSLEVSDTEGVVESSLESQDSSESEL